jgi:transcriptional regulator with XRE-family HTH domain
VVEATYTVKSMAKPKRGRSTVVTDNHVGGRIRERRIMLGLTQQRLAEMIGVSCQQAHKYERGINRVSAGRLFEIASALSAPITYFYEGIGQEGPRQITLHQRMQLEIARNFAEIRNEKHQEAVSQLARVLTSR